jgi:tripartite-type tricarboxylate transporter receptor subunit TctC
LLNSMLAGQVQLAFVTIPGAQGHIKSGKLRGVAVTGAKPTPLLPGLPTVADTLPGYKFVGDIVLLAPPKTPATIINRLNRETLQVINAADVKERLLGAGFEVEGSSPQELGAWMKAEMVRWGKIIKDAGITPE